METFCGDIQTSRDEDFKNHWLHREHPAMKPIGSLVNSTKSHENHPRFSVHFDDGMTILLHTVAGELVYENMLSVGVGSYYLTKGKWPSGKNLEKRVNMSIEYIQKNIKNNRYKQLKK